MYQQCRCRCYPCTLAYLEAHRARVHGVTLPRVASTVPVVGTRRRIEALHARGWSDAELGRRLGMAPQYVHKLRAVLTSVQPSTAERIARLYDELWDEPPTGVCVGKVQRLAARRGWPLPLDWDDEQLDDPDAVPYTPTDRSWDLRPCGTHAAYRRHQRRSEPPCQACRNAENRRAQDRKKAA